MTNRFEEPKKRQSHGLAVIIVFVLLLLVLRLSPFSGPSWPKIGDAAPNLNSFPVEGTIPPLTNKVVLLDFWASWCGPCVRSMPIIDEMHQRYSSRGLVVIGVSVDAEKTDMIEFLRNHRVQFPNVRDAFGHLSQAYRVSAIPRTFIIGADGKFVAAHEGFSPGGTRQELIDQIEAALKAAGR